MAGAGRKWVAPGLILQALRREADPTGPWRVGFTASRKVGIAVLRNRARRRLRAAVARVMPDHAVPGHDYVLIARGATVRRAYPALVEDLRAALRRLGTYRDGGSPGAAGPGSDGQEGTAMKSTLRAPREND